MDVFGDLEISKGDVVTRQQWSHFQIGTVANVFYPVEGSTPKRRYTPECILVLGRTTTVACWLLGRQLADIRTKFQMKCSLHL